MHFLSEASPGVGVDTKAPITKNAALRLSWAISVASPNDPSGEAQGRIGAKRFATARIFKMPSATKSQVIPVSASLMTRPQCVSRTITRLVLRELSSCNHYEISYTLISKCLSFKWRLTLGP